MDSISTSLATLSIGWTTTEYAYEAYGEWNPPGGSPWGFRYSVRIRNIYRSESHLFHRRLDEAMDTEIWKHARLVAIVLG